MATLETLVVKINADLASFDKQMGRAERRVTRFGRNIQNVGRNLSLGITLPLAGVAAASVRAATNLDSLVRGLEAVGGGSAEAQRQLVRLQDVAKLPGLGFAEAIQGSVRLQAVGFSAAFAERSLRAFGNAIATTGGGKTELDRITVQLGQLGAKGKVLAQDLRPIIEAAPLVGRALQQAFGTVDAEQIQELGITTQEFLDRLLTELERMPQVSRSAKTSFEDFSDSLFRAGSAVGNVVLPPLVRFLDASSALFDRVATGSPVLLKFGIAMAGIAAAIGPTLLAIGTLVKLLPVMKVGLLALGTVSTGPIGLVVAGVGALAAAWLAVTTNADKARRAQQQASQSFFDSLSGRSPEELDSLAGDALRKRNEAMRALEELRSADTSRFNSRQRRQIEERIALREREVSHYQSVFIRILAAKRGLVQAEGDEAKAISFRVGVLEQSTQTAIRLLERQRELQEQLREIRFDQRFVDSADAADDLNKKLADTQRQLEIVNAELERMPAAFLRMARAQQQLERVRGFNVPTIDPATTGARDRARAFLPEFALQRDVLPPLQEVEQGEGFLEKLGLGPLREAFGQLTQASGPLFVAFNLVKGALEPLQPVIEALAQPIQIVGVLLGKVFAPIVKAASVPLRLIGVVATYVVQALGFLIEAIAKFINKIIPFVDPLKGVERFGQQMQDEAVKARNALNDAGKAAEYLGKEINRTAESLRNVPLDYNLNLLRTRVAQGTLGASGGTASSFSINTVNIQAAPGDQPRDLWNKFVQGVKDAAAGGDPFARQLQPQGI